MSQGKKISFGIHDLDYKAAHQLLIFKKNREAGMGWIRMGSASGTIPDPELQSLVRKTSTDAVDGGALGAEKPESSATLPSGAPSLEASIDVLQRFHSAETSAQDAKIIQEYAILMKKGLWVLNGQPIIVSDAGEILDGRKRLKACILANYMSAQEAAEMASEGQAHSPAVVRLRTILAVNVPRDTLATMDQHARRSFSQVMGSRGIPNAGGVMRLLTRLIRFEKGSLGYENSRTPWSELELVLDKIEPHRQKVMDWASRARAAGFKIDQPAGALFAMIANMSGKDGMIEHLISPSEGEDPKIHAFRSNLMNLLDVEDFRDNSPEEYIFEMAVICTYFNDLIEGNLDATYTPRWVRSKPREPSSENKYLEKDPNGLFPTLRPRRFIKLFRNGTPHATEFKALDLKSPAPRNSGIPDIIGYQWFSDVSLGESGAAAGSASSKLENMLREAVNADRRPMINIVTVTPEDAKRWLNDYNTGNRPIRQSQLQNLTNDIRAGRWMVNAQPICFAGVDGGVGDNKPRLLNGQHRLMACVRAGQNIDVAIAWGVHENAFTTFDTQARTQKWDLSGWKIPSGELAALAKLLIAEREAGRIGEGQIGGVEVPVLSGLNVMPVALAANIKNAITHFEAIYSDLKEFGVSELAENISIKPDDLLTVIKEQKAVVTCIERAYPERSLTTVEIEEITSPEQEQLNDLYIASRKYSMESSARAIAPERISVWLMRRTLLESKHYGDEFNRVYVHRRAVTNQELRGKTPKLPVDKEVVNELIELKKRSTAVVKLQAALDMIELERAEEKNKAKVGAERDINSAVLVKRLYQVWRAFLEERSKEENQDEITPPLAVPKLIEATQDGLGRPQKIWKIESANGRSVKQVSEKVTTASE